MPNFLDDQKLQHYNTLALKDTLKAMTEKSPPCPYCDSKPVMGTQQRGWCFYCGTAWKSEDEYNAWVKTRNAIKRAEQAQGEGE